MGRLLNNSFAWISVLSFSSTTRVSKTYVLETFFYNLEKSEDKQLVALVTSKTVDPSGVTKVAKAYSKEVLNSLKK